MKQMTIKKVLLSLAVVVVARIRAKYSCSDGGSNWKTFEVVLPDRHVNHSS